MKANPAEIITTANNFFSKIHDYPSEEICMKVLIESSSFSDGDHLISAEITKKYIQNIRKNYAHGISTEQLMQAYPITTQEGRSLMELAEALLRIPDRKTRLQFITDHISMGTWSKEKQSLIAKIAGVGLNISANLLEWRGAKKGIFKLFSKVTGEISAPIIDKSFSVFIKKLGQQFVLAETIEGAVKTSKKQIKKGEYSYSYDMLGEAARTMGQAGDFTAAYMHAIKTIGEQFSKDLGLKRPGVSIKLSALHPRYEQLQEDRVFNELYPTLLSLCKESAKFDLMLTIDAEESSRLSLSLEIIERLVNEPDLQSWQWLGLAIQAYAKQATNVIEGVVNLARSLDRKIHIRLVKGAYWDSEIKHAQIEGHKSYSLFTKKCHTDVSYLACAEKLLRANDVVYSQFATHNAYSIAAIETLAKRIGSTYFEFQRLHGMGESLHVETAEREESPILTRIYAPVGVYHDLLSYLIRRLLENGANSSFVHSLYDESIPAENLAINPFVKAALHGLKENDRIPLPVNLYGSNRPNSQGIDLDNIKEQASLKAKVDAETLQENRFLRYPKDHTKALERISKAQDSWQNIDISVRADTIHKIGDAMQDKMPFFIKILQEYGRKTVSDAVGEVREAIDFCYYYASQARQLQSRATILPGPTGEINELTWHPRGTFACISPWNFPLAIMCGQIVASLVSGNGVIAKSAQQTIKIAEAFVDLAYKVGIPTDLLILSDLGGSKFGKKVLNDKRISGVVFTGSTETAQQIQLTLTNRGGQITPLIAETGGLNVMFVDSSTLFEQSLPGILDSAFQSAGQRCSALRCLIVQEEVADELTNMLRDASKELRLGEVTDWRTDVGPVIDKASKKQIDSYIETLKGMEKDKLAKCIYAHDTDHAVGDFVGPQIWEIHSLDLFNTEIFGPVLHIVRYKRKDFEKMIKTVNDKNFGLTMGLDSRLPSKIKTIREMAKVGNLYINRNIIGATVGVQPFGGEGLSGTGFKAGGPHYLMRFMVERTFTQNLTASGGNLALLSLE